MLGMNVDYRHWTDASQHAVVHDLSINLKCKIVRTVLKPNEREQWNKWYTLLKTYGLELCAVKARESGYTSQYKGYLFDYIQTGNEPFNTGTSSYTQTPEELNKDLQETRYLFPSTYHICAGLADGDPSKLDLLDLVYVDAIAAHPGIETPDTIDKYVYDYVAHGRGKPLIITEFYSVELVRILNNDPRVHAAIFFCYDDRMVDGHGLLDHGKEKPEYYKFVNELGNGNTVTSLNVGTGVLAKMEELSDSPIRDSEWHTNDDGSFYEKAYGEKGFYEASNHSGEWKVYFRQYPLV